MINKDDFLDMLISSVLSLTSSDMDALACMSFLHSCGIELSSLVMLSDAGTERILSLITRRHAAEIVARVMNKIDDSRCEPDYWHKKYDTDTPFEVMSDIHSAWIYKVNDLSNMMINTGLVSDLYED